MEDVLKRHNLRNTAARRAVLELFDQSRHALTHAQIEEKIGAQFDRVTLYRTLRSFEDLHLIHRILSDSGVWVYALCRDCHNEKAEPLSDKHEHTHHHHVHFKCDNCQNTYCLEQTEIPKMSLPTGYIAKDWQLLATGLCKNCSSAGGK
jgi:Fur family transcriptional regulator, ferric uptake regulator